MTREAEESRNLCDQLFRALAPRPEDGLTDWNIGPGYDGEPDLLVPSDRPECPTCGGEGRVWKYMERYYGLAGEPCPDCTLPSGEPCSCKGSGQFPDGLPCPVHSSRETLAAGCDNPKANGTYPTYGNDAKNERESGL